MNISEQSNDDANALHSEYRNADSEKNHVDDLADAEAVRLSPSDQRLGRRWTPSQQARAPRRIRGANRAPINPAKTGALFEI